MGHGKGGKNLSKKRENTLRLCWLHAFIAVIENDGKEAKAAKELGLDGSTVNRYLGNLDAWVRTPLFTQSFPKELSSKGHEFEPIAREVVTLLEGFRSVPAAVQTPDVRKSAKDIKVVRAD